MSWAMIEQNTFKEKEENEENECVSVDNDLDFGSGIGSDALMLCDFRF